MAPPAPALVFGCGYLGSRVADAWRASGRPVHALTRGRPDALRLRGLTPVVGDVLDPVSLRGLPEVATVLYAVGFDRKAGRGMREVYVDGLRHAVAAVRAANPHRMPKWLHVSSTGVYGHTGGEWVDETSPTEPRETSGQVVLEAEQVLRADLPDAVILRFAGIYGPGRLLRGDAVRARQPYVGDAEKWLNLIHVADGAAAVLAAESHAPPGSLYAICDGNPVRRRDFYTRLAELLHAPAATFAPGPDGEHAEPNRRVNSGRARRELGWQPAFATYEAGLADAVAGV